MDRPQLQWRNIEKCQKPFIFFFFSSFPPLLLLTSHYILALFLTSSACWLPSSSSSTNVYLYCLFSFSFFKFLFTQYFFKKNFLLFLILLFSWGSKKIQHMIHSFDVAFAFYIVTVLWKKKKDSLLFPLIYMYICSCLMPYLSDMRKEREDEIKKNCSSFPFHIIFFLALLWCSNYM